jgi:hypothetical protein
MVGYYHLIGIMCGLAIYNFTIINVPFPLVLYTKLLGDKEASRLTEHCKSKLATSTLLITMPISCKFF